MTRQKGMQIYKIFTKNVCYENYINILVHTSSGRFYELQNLKPPSPSGDCEMVQYSFEPKSVIQVKLLTFHYILECKELLMFSHKYLEDEYCSASNTTQFWELMSFTNGTTLKKLCNFKIIIHSVIKQYVLHNSTFFSLHCTY